ncbi:hypothetical protein ACFSTH_01520 [Paenibacillus yanchengensis]|uniref:DUF3923 family protein n=1 Tax=Paenibacillus yanchengensis TaxID=2035833 RepID=A0ABW4YRA3_9BACL
MKTVIISYLLAGIWLGTLIYFLPHSNWYISSAHNTWNFLIINTLIFVPIVLVMFIADRVFASTKQKKR